jgi:hypothetical protein
LLQIMANTQPLIELKNSPGFILFKFAQVFNSEK